MNWDVFEAPFPATLFCMPDDTKRDEPAPFPVEVTVNGVKVTVTLMLKPGTTVTSEQKPEPPKSATPSDV